MITCLHLGAEQGRQGREPHFACSHPKHPGTTPAGCLLCPDYCLPQKRTHPKQLILNRHGEFVDLSDLFGGAAAFAIFGGPSAREMPLQQLEKRGCLIFSTNNCLANLPFPLRPHVWTHTDPTHKFHDAIWKDPAILKFTPEREWDSQTKEPRPGDKRKHKGVRTRAADGVLEFIPGQAARYMPGVFGYKRNTTFRPAEWLWEDSINRGNDKASFEAKNGWTHTINTMFTVVRLAFYLGVKTLYLVGCDFHMSGERAYGFNQNKWRGGVESNNRYYFEMCLMFDALLPHFEAAGFQVFNCTPGSCLWSFPELDFAEAVEQATAGIEQELDCSQWYDSLTEENHDDQPTDR